jgi:hypothetical protein
MARWLGALGYNTSFPLGQRILAQPRATLSSANDIQNYTLPASESHREAES